MNILDILRKYSDPDHRISQKDIIDILKNKYNMVADRKAIRRNIMNLMDLGTTLNTRKLSEWCLIKSRANLKKAIFGQTIIM